MPASVVSGLGGDYYGPFNVTGFRGARGRRHDRLGAQGRGAGVTTDARRVLPDLRGTRGGTTNSTSPASVTRGAERGLRHRFDLAGFRGPRG